MIDNILRQMIVVLVIALLFTSCVGNLEEKEFLAKYECEEFSQFTCVHTFIRDLDNEGNPIIMIDAPSLINDSLKVGLYVVTLNKQNYQIIKTSWTIAAHSVDADTARMQQLAQTFLQYGIARLKVDEQGNVLVYLKDPETLSIVRFTNERELAKYNKEMKLVKIRKNWYKPKY